MPKGVREREDSELTLNLWRLDECYVSEGRWRSKEEDLALRREKVKFLSLGEIYILFFNCR